MADILARQRSLIGTTAQWAAADIVVGDGEIALERTAGGTIKMKMGDGVSTYSALPFFGSSWGAAAWTTPSRALATEYQNTNAFPISIAAWGMTNGLAESFILYAAATSGGTFFVVSGSQSNETGTYEHFVGGIIPAGWYYKVIATGGSPALHGWNEMV